MRGSTSRMFALIVGWAIGLQCGSVTPEVNGQTTATLSGLTTRSYMILHYPHFGTVKEPEVVSNNADLLFTVPFDGIYLHLRKLSVQATDEKSLAYERDSTNTPDLPLSTPAYGTLIDSFTNLSPNERTVIDNQRGLFYTYPFHDEWGAIGADFGTRTPDYQFDKMTPDAIKGIQTIFQHHRDTDDQYKANFPIAELRAFEADEVAMGRPPIFVTATYHGIKRRELLKSNLDDFFAQSQAVNLGDSRYVKWYIHRYARHVLGQPQRPNWWLGIDNGIFNKELYVVLDDAGKQIAGVSWDAPFPQTDQAYVDATEAAFRQMNEQAPDLPIIINTPELADSFDAQYEKVFANTSGILWETAFELPDNAPEKRDTDWRTRYSRFATSDTGKVQIFMCFTHGRDDLLSNYFMAYLIFSGTNAFFGPLDGDGPGEYSLEVDPAKYQGIMAALGGPEALPESILESGRSPGSRLYSRRFEGGLVYFNLTRITKQIQLPNNATYYDAAGHAVTSLTLADKATGYVLKTPGARAAKPAINPRHAGEVNGPIAVTLSTTEATATIRYTLDGSEPTSNSPTYTSPLFLAASATVKAKAFRQGMLDSFISHASYSITNTLPKVGFVLASDGASEFIATYYPLLGLDHTSANVVRVSYTVSDGTAKGGGVDYTLDPGTVTFQPGQKFAYFPISIANHTPHLPPRTLTLELRGPNNATLGAHPSFTYTINQGTTTSVEKVESVLPRVFELYQNYPNPFNPTSTIRYDIPKTGFVNISVYDILGREIKVLVNEEKSPGHYEIIFETKNLASGIYFYTIKTAEFTQSKKMILLR